MTALSFTVPFQLTSQGSVATTEDPQAIARQRVRALVATTQGSRVMLPDYGLNLPSYLFAPDIPESVDRLTNDIVTAMQQFEPTITILNVLPIINDAAIGLEDIGIDFTQANDDSFTPALTATVLVGGTVVGD